MPRGCLCVCTGVDWYWEFGNTCVYCCVMLGYVVSGGLLFSVLLVGFFLVSLGVWRCVVFVRGGF